MKLGLLDNALDHEASLRGWCAKFMVHITGREVRDECVSPSYPLVNQVRQKRLKWLACAEGWGREFGKGSCGQDVQRVHQGQQQALC